MGIHVVKVPDIGEGIAEVELVEWRVRPGDTVVADQPLVDVMTDKATVEVPSPVDGKVLAANGNAGTARVVNNRLYNTCAAFTVLRRATVTGQFATRAQRPGRGLS